MTRLNILLINHLNIVNIIMYAFVSIVLWLHSVMLHLVVRSNWLTENSFNRISLFLVSTCLRFSLTYYIGPIINDTQDLLIFLEVLGCMVGFVMLVGHINAEYGILDTINGMIS